MTKTLEAKVAKDIVLHFGEIRNARNTHGNVQFYIGTKYKKYKSISVTDIKRMADLYQAFLNAKRDEFHASVEANREKFKVMNIIEDDFKQKTGFTFTQSLTYNMRGLKYELPN